VPEYQVAAAVWIRGVLAEGDPRVRRLFADPAAVEADYFWSTSFSRRHSRGGAVTPDRRRGRARG
jgi:hypothetical protein